MYAHMVLTPIEDTGMRMRRAHTDIQHTAERTQVDDAQCMYV